MQQFFLLVFLVLGGSSLAGSVKVINQGNEALVETLGKYNGRKLDAGLKFIIPFLDKISGVVIFFIICAQKFLILGKS